MAIAARTPVRTHPGSRSTWDPGDLNPWDPEALPFVTITRNGRGIRVRYAILPGQHGSSSDPEIPDEIEIHHATWQDRDSGEPVDLTPAEEARAEVLAWADARDV